MNEFQVEDGVWTPVHTHTRCCDCQLVHRIEYRWNGKTLEARATRMPRLTARARKKHGVIIRRKNVTVGN